ncbi:MAG: SDR family oxidoreductase, partial [Myxococcota bacterium]
MNDDGTTASPPLRRWVLLTGFPTFAARYLLWHMAECEPNTHIACIVTEDELGRAQALIDAHQLTSRIQLLTGDITALDLGLSGREYLDVVQNVTDIYHLASAWTTTTDRRLLEQVNVVGTRHVLQCVRDAHQLNRYNHLSTAYVCGDTTGVIMEEELLPDALRNPYEASQYEAEVAVRRLMDLGLPISIYRPSTIVGHSATGQIDHFTGPYLFFAPWSVCPPMYPFPSPAVGRVPSTLSPSTTSSAPSTTSAFTPMALGAPTTS